MFENLRHWWNAPSTPGKKLPKRWCTCGQSNWARVYWMNHMNYRAWKTHCMTCHDDVVLSADLQHSLNTLERMK